MSDEIIEAAARELDGVLARSASWAREDVTRQVLRAAMEAAVQGAPEMLDEESKVVGWDRLCRAANLDPAS